MDLFFPAVEAHFSLESEEKGGEVVLLVPLEVVKKDELVVVSEVAVDLVDGIIHGCSN